jgi:hypothetical protein
MITAQLARSPTPDRRGSAAGCHNNSHPIDHPTR